MITVPTVLVLGAGASKPFGFPTGKELLDLVCLKFNESDKKIHKYVLNDSIDYLEFNAKTILEFREALSKSECMSVDEFLEHQPDFIELGKACIARELILYERAGNLRGHWYQYLLSKLNAHFDDFGENKLSVITYNYDRSLEQYLFTTLRNRTNKNKTDDEVSQKLKSIPIIHLHGKLGDLPWQNKDTTKCRKYEPSLNKESVKIGSNGIKIICEDISNYPAFEEAYKVLTNAEYIYFLGFGYNETNIKRLNIPIATKVKAVQGSSKGFSSIERNVIRSKRWYPDIENLPFAQRLVLYNDDKDVLDFLRNYTDLH